MAKAPGYLEGLIESNEGRVLQQLAKEVPTTETIVELGSYKGKSTSYLARGSQQGNGAIVHAIDLWGKFGSHYGGRKGKESIFAQGHEIKRQFDEQLELAGVTDVVRPWEGSTQEVFERWKANSVMFKNIGLLFIDAAHDYDNAMNDFKNWSPYVVEGGVVAFHDYGNPRWPHGVTRVVDETIGTWSTFQTVGTLAWATKL